MLQPGDALVLQPDLHEDDAVDAPARDDALEGAVVFAARGGEQDVEIGAGGGVDHAGHEAELHVGQPLAGGWNDQADGAGAALFQRPGGGVGTVAQFVDDRLDAALGLLRYRAFAGQRVGDGAA